MTLGDAASLDCFEVNLAGRLHGFAVLSNPRLQEGTGAYLLCREIADDHLLCPMRKCSKEDEWEAPPWKVSFVPQVEDTACSRVNI